MTAIFEGSSLDATLRHIAQLRQKQDVLMAAQIAAEEQMLHRVGVMYTAGETDTDELAALYEFLAMVGLPGFTKRWDAAISFSTSRLSSLRQHNRYLQRHAPNMPDGTWRGTWPLGDSPVPANGIPVFYVLYDATGTPCYVGSSKWFKGRLQGHKEKPFTTWSASRCDDREAAYALEDLHLAEALPYLNKRAGR
jgi:hypothetical protein